MKQRFIKKTAQKYTAKANGKSHARIVSRDEKVVILALNGLAPTLDRFIVILTDVLSTTFINAAREVARFSEVMSDYRIDYGE